MEAVSVLIIFHATFGGIALLAGLAAMVAVKGNKLHKKSGLIFHYSMLISAVTAMLVAFFPNHKSPFLFSVGIFSLYFILTGKRALRFKQKDIDVTIDKWISRIMIVSGILLLFLPIILYKEPNIVLSVFAVVGIIFSARDLILFKNTKKLRKVWLKLHLGKSISAYISTTTAFVVVNNFFPNIYGWFIPGIIGGIVIRYWIRKVSTQKTS